MKMEREKKSKIKKIHKFDLKEKASSLVFALIALVLTAIVFGGLLFLQDMLTEEIIYQNVIVAKTDIPENEIITEANASSYFTTKDINVLDATSGYLTSLDAIIGKQSKVSLLQGEIVSAKDFKDLQKYANNYNNPVEISVDVGSIANADGGKVRSGDLINLTMMFSREQLRYTSTLDTVSQVNGSDSIFTVDFGNSESITEFDTEDLSMEDDIESLIDEDNSFDNNSTETKVVSPLPIETNTSSDDSSYFFEYYAKYVLENIYVVKALDSSGNELSPTDTSSSANILVFVIDKKDESAVNNALANCSNIRVSKVVEKADIVESSGFSNTVDQEVNADTEEASDEDPVTEE